MSAQFEAALRFAERARSNLTRAHTLAELALQELLAVPVTEPKQIAMMLRMATLLDPQTSVSEHVLLALFLSAGMQADTGGLLRPRDEKAGQP